MENRFLNFLYFEYQDKKFETIEKLIDFLKKTEFYDDINNFDKEKKLQTLVLLFCRLTSNELYNQVKQSLDKLCVYQTVCFYDFLKRENCEECWASGKQGCFTCESSGMVDNRRCDECKGKGETKCKACEGKGYKILEKPLLIGEVNEYVTFDKNLIPKIQKNFKETQPVDEEIYELERFRTNTLYFNEVTDKLSGYPVNNPEFYNKCFINQPCYKGLVNNVNQLIPNEKFKG